MQPAQVSRQQRQKRGNEHEQPESTEALGDWRLNRPRAEPLHPKQRWKHGQQEGPNAEELQH